MGKIKTNKRLPQIILIGLLLALPFQIAFFILGSSNAYDEAAVIGAGVSYIKTGKLDLEHKVHPPLQKYLMGFFVNLLSPNFDFNSDYLKADQFYEFGHMFLFHNSVKPELILAMGRLPSLLLSLLLAAFVVMWSERWFGPWGAVGALTAYVFEPNILASSGLATMDMGIACFMFIACYFLICYLEEQKISYFVLSGLAAGCASMTKIPGVFVFVWLALILGVRWKNRTTPPPHFPYVVSRTFLLGLLATVVVLIVYQFRYMGMLGEAVQAMFQLIFDKNSRHSILSYLHGELKKGGWWYYYPVVLGIKCTIPFLVMVVTSFFYLSRDKIKVLSIPIVTFIFICTVAQKQNGLRYLLPIFPFFCVLIGGTLAAGIKRKWLAVSMGTLLLWHTAEAAFLFPNYLTYFNQFVGGPSKGYRWLVDCNLDWGQDFPAIKKYLLEQGSPEVILACLGNGNRPYYLGEVQDLVVVLDYPDPAFEHVNSLNPKREMLIVSASFFQGFGLPEPGLLHWLQAKQPTAQIANSSFAYDITSDAASQFNIGKIYKRYHVNLLALRQFKRAQMLQPNDPAPWMEMRDVYLDSQMPKEAAECAKKVAELQREKVRR